MSAIVIRVEHLSKSYQYGTISHGTLYKDLQSWWARLRGKEDPNTPVTDTHRPGQSGERFWALHDISFDVHQGEIVGIIGRNGAGKSTVLKILSEITTPTKGCVKLNGRVGSLLEVGTGFHPELTGRENIYLNGAILGMNRREITKKFDEIVDFADIEEFIDTPVKRYSSGMYVRLAFGVAAHLEPEILLIDEVLAVGDLTFQQKCVRKMGKVAEEGRTVLVVSHNMRVVETLTERCLYLNNGSLVKEGPALEVIKKYQKEALNELEYNLPSEFNGNIKNAVVTLDNILLTTGINSQQTNIFAPGQPMRLYFELNAREDVLEAVVCIRVYRDRLAILGNNSEHTLGRLSLKKGQKKRLHISFDALWLMPGHYVMVIFVKPSYFSRVPDSISIFYKIPLVVQGSREYGGGYVYIKQNWSLK